MPPVPVLKQHYTLEEYLEFDKNSEEKYEYFEGEVFAMAGEVPATPGSVLILAVCSAKN